MNRVSGPEELEGLLRLQDTRESCVKSMPFRSACFRFASAMGSQVKALQQICYRNHPWTSGIYSSALRRRLMRCR